MRGRSRTRARRGGRTVELVLTLVLCAMCAAGCARPARAAPRGALDATPTATATPTPVSAASLTYAVIGASDAFGIGTNNPVDDAWPTVVARRLGPNTHLINLGIPGATVELATRDEVPIAAATTPDVITVWLGINDFDDGTTLLDFTKGLSALLSQLSAHTSARIYVGNLPDLTLLPYFGERPADTLTKAVQQWNKAISGVCQRTGATLVDLYTDWSELALHPEYISPDGLHPSTAGASRIGDMFLVAIESGAP